MHQRNNRVKYNQPSRDKPNCIQNIIQEQQTTQQQQKHQKSKAQQEIQSKSSESNNNPKQQKPKRSDRVNKQGQYKMHNSSKQQKKEKFYCRFFMQGTCKNGLNCKFIHPVNAQSQKPNEKQQKEALNSQQAPSPSNKPPTTHPSTTQQPNPKPVQGESPNPKQHFRDLYYEKMIESMKLKCYSCGNRELPVYLSCGCGSICEKCAKGNKPCGGENHVYDTKVYIK